jgi:hypothetical protein
MTLQSPTSFEAFNARALRPEEVARNFVPSAHYRQLAKHRHTIVVGPRGSGKTTLLKMLQQPALETWDDQLADTYRSSINYTGVFIATDISWGAQIEALGDGKLDTESHKRLSIATFTTHVLRALVMAMLYRIEPVMDKDRHVFRRVSLSDEQESALVGELSKSWQIETSILSLLALKQALSTRLLQIRALASREALREHEGRSNRLSETEFLHLHFIDAISIATEIFNDLVGEPEGRWALLFDELELAPQWIQDELLRALRSTDPKFLYKLAMSPFTYNASLMETALSAAPDQDFDQIALWYVDKRQSYKFCEGLWYALLKARGLESQSPKSLLGPSHFEPTLEDTTELESPYAPNSRISQRFLTLAEHDQSFRGFLNEKEINPRRLHLLQQTEMDSIVRKIAPLVILREYYRAPDQPENLRKKTTRSRKTAGLYTGAESLFAVSEGNPRWFIAIVGRLLDRWQSSSKKIQQGAQANEILIGSQRFSAMLRTIPASGDGCEWRKRGLLSLIDTIASFFHAQAVLKEFTAEPPASFIVDSHIGNDVLMMLGQALNAGAIVYVPDNENQLLLTSLRGKRFRTSYLLAPIYKLPLRLGIAVSLSSILRTEPVSDPSLPFREELEQS